MEYLSGNIGHGMVVIAFLSAFLSAIGYFKASRVTDSEKISSWRKFGRIHHWVHTGAVLGCMIALYYIVYNHQYQYYYALDHTSNQLPIEYVIACFWEGQEGSFLIWIFWNVLIGVFLLRLHKGWEIPLMAIFATVQVFLTSMILGVVLWGEFKIGSSPFTLTTEVLGVDKIPQDGNGLNPLLQNYWMVIHPPTLFLGFAMTLVPFAFAMAGLWQKKHKDWLKPALPWSLLSAAILGLGIVMGAYWAYETLNFEGYWNWDPVENAIYVPWLFLVAGIHTMVAARQSSSSLKTSYILMIATFVLILYSTFLTRSGVLGNASVHSFTDLGLSGQLLIYLFAFLAGSVILAIARWKTISSDNKELTTYSREFWIFVGATILCIGAFQVIADTSRPVYNKIAEAFDQRLDLAPRTASYYNNIQIWLAVGIALFSGIGQYFWWKKIRSGASFLNTIAVPLIITLLVSALWIALSKEDNFVYMALITTSVFALATNSFMLARLLKQKPILSGGAVAHIGVAIMLIGILYSAGYSKIVSINTTGLIYDAEAQNAEFNEKNVLLWLDEPVAMDKYQITYKGMFRKVGTQFIALDDLVHLEQNPYKAIVSQASFITNNKKGDTLEIQPENFYYRVEYRDKKGRIFYLHPRVQVNGMSGGQYVVSPDIYKHWQRDLYTHITMVYPDPAKGREWNTPQSYEVSLGDTLYLNDYVAIFEGIHTVNEVGPVKVSEDVVAVKAKLKVFGKNNRTYIIEPIFALRQSDNLIAYPAEEIPALGLSFTFKKIDPLKQTFTFEVQEGQKDFIIMKAIEKPWINLLWIGSIVIVVGMILAFARRIKK